MPRNFANKVTNENRFFFLSVALTEYRKCDELREEVSRFVEEFKSNAGRRKAHFLKELSRLKGKNYKIETRL